MAPADILLKYCWEKEGSTWWSGEYSFVSFKMQKKSQSSEEVW
jgi:hypothetical protein